jgi:transposase
VERRHQVVGMLTAEQQRVQQALPAVRAKVAAHSVWLEQALADLDAELEHTLRASPLWRERDQLRHSVPGVGPAVSPTLGHCWPTCPRWATARSSRWPPGWVWRRSPATAAPGGAPAPPGGGRRPLRAALDMAARVGIRHNAVVRTFYERLLAQGTPKQVALTACRHKLLIILHAVLHDRTPWQPTLLAP